MCKIDLSQSNDKIIQEIIKKHYKTFDIFKVDLEKGLYHFKNDRGIILYENIFYTLERILRALRGKLDFNLKETLNNNIDINFNYYIESIIELNQVISTCFPNSEFLEHIEHNVYGSIPSIDLRV